MTLHAGLARADALRLVREAFAARGIDAADARFLTLHALGLTQADLILGGAEPVGDDGAARLDEAMRRRLAGEPAARIIGAWEFWGLPFALSPETLVPRPDTETVVEAALALSGRDDPMRVLDLGAGSGCILTSILSERPSAFGIGLDRSPGALSTAKANAADNGVSDRAAFVAGDWCAALSGAFDLIVSNPPYIASAVIPTLSDEVRLHDPLAALDGGSDGLGAYRIILRQVAEGMLLAEGGAMVLEVGHDQAEGVADLARAAGLPGITGRRDLAGHVRALTLTTRGGVQKKLVALAPNR